MNGTDDQPTPGTLENTHSICGGLILPGTAEGPPTPVGMELCNGTLYRQCAVPGFREAMCYSARFMGISCSVNPFPIEMQRRQIQLGIGAPVILCMKRGLAASIDDTTHASSCQYLRLANLSLIS